MNTKDNEYVLELRNIHKDFFPGTVDHVKALRGINLQVKPGDFISIIGSNGAGKSTALNVVAGVYPPERGGQVLIKGDDVTSLPEYKHSKYVGRVWQDPGIGTASELSIEENLSIAVLRGEKRGLRLAVNKKRRQMFKDALATLGLGLENRLSAMVGTLSGGQRQALSLVMATISNPDLLLLDEHIATLDPKTAETVMDMTDKIIEGENMTALMVTHNMEKALKHGSRLIMMHEGRIVLDFDEQKKNSMTGKDLIDAFIQASGDTFDDDKVLLSR